MTVVLETSYPASARAGKESWAADNTPLIRKSSEPFSNDIDNAFAIPLMLVCGGALTLFDFVLDVGFIRRIRG
jgi:hypothetical protein